MIRFALPLALASAAVHDVAAQCRPVVPEAYELTSAGRVRLDGRAERGTLPNGAPHTYVAATITHADKPGTGPAGSILGIWVRRDSAWAQLEIQNSKETTRTFPYVHGFGGPPWDPGSNIDVLMEWQLAGESAPHCSLLRSTVTAVLFTAPTVILKESIARDPAGVAKNTGRLVVALRDANNPLSPVKDKSSIVLDTAISAGRLDGSLDIFAKAEADVVHFAQLPARQIALTVRVDRFQYFRAFVNIVAGCETVVEVFLGPRSGMHQPPVTDAHATVTTCAPERCLGFNNMVVPCGPATMPRPGRPPAVKRDSTQSLRD